VELVLVERIEADRQPAQAGGAQRHGVLGEEAAVGGHRQVEVAERGEAAHEVVQVAAQQRFAAGQADLAHAELDEEPCQPLDLLEMEQRVARQELPVRPEHPPRHAVRAAEVAAVGHRDAEVAQRTAEPVGGRERGAGLHALDSTVSLGPALLRCGAMSERVEGRERRPSKAVWGAGWGVAAALVAAMGSAPAVSEVPAAAVRMQEEALAGDGAWRLVESLTTEVGPRFAGTAGDGAAIVWAETKLRQLGFPVVRREPVPVPRWIRGEAAGEIVAPWPQRVALLALGGSVGTPEGGLEAEVVGVEDLAALEQLGDDALRGRIVFFHRRMRRAADGAGYGETVAIRTRGAAAAAKRGAVAVLIRSVGTDSNRLPHTGATRYEEGGPRIPAAALSVPDADLLERQLGSGETVRFRLALGCRRDGEADSANVVGEIPGTASPEEIVLLVAHLDSWDVGAGAQDNATGVAVAIEAARLAAAAPNGKPRRTLRVLLTANEEFGLSGARAYAAAYVAEVPAHVLALEADSGAGRVLTLRTRFAPGDAAAAEELAARLVPLGIALAEGAATGGADLIPLRPLGVPLVDLRQDASAYFDIHHTDNDTLDKIDPEALRQVVAAFATAAEWAANRASRLAPAPSPEEEP
jgi:carboxypeptidase Q